MMRVTDNRGGSAVCSATVIVQDTAAPAVTASLDPLGAGDDGDDDDEGCFTVNFSATDICDMSPSVSAVLVMPGLADRIVSNGDVIEFEMEDDADDAEIEYEDGILEIEASSLTLRVTSTDAAGNTATLGAQPSGLASDNDDDGDGDDDD